MRIIQILLVMAAGAGTIAVASVMAQDLPKTSISAHVTATPSKAGTEAHPQGIAVSGTGKLTTEPGFDPPVVTGVDLLVGRGVVYHGDDYVKCSKGVLDRKGPAGCPKESIIGNMTAIARADTVNTRADIVLVNGGSTRAFAYTTLTNPARVRETVVVKITKLNGKWAYRTTARVPKSLQVVAGVPIQVTSVKFKFGGKPYAKELITSTSCPKGGWKYQVTAHYSYDLLDTTTEQTMTGSVPCTS